MTFLDHCQLMARYNQWMNAKVLAAAAGLPAESLVENKGAFFGSILGTLNHLLVTDLMWIHRLKSHPKAGLFPVDILNRPTPTRLDEALHDSLGGLKVERDAIDSGLIIFANGLSADDFDIALAYRRANGEAQKKTLGSILSHLFNHQTHHRGQITTLLSQSGVDVGVTDLNALTPNLL